MPAPGTVGDRERSRLHDAKRLFSELVASVDPERARIDKGDRVLFLVGRDDPSIAVDPQESIERPNARLARDSPAVRAEHREHARRVQPRHVRLNWRNVSCDLARRAQE